jgi:4-hydroxy-tetrahydrodipicolinate reductase
MNIVICGYGRMGKEVELALTRRGHSVAARIDPYVERADAAEVGQEQLANADAVIEFSSREAVVQNARAYAQAGVPAVVGTTGWEDQLEEVRSTIENSSIAYLRGANFSIGANLFFAIVSQAATLLDAFDDYDVMVHETHHRFKKDSPSGTALTVGNKLLERLSRKSELVTETLHRPIEQHELQVSSLRGGHVPGTHTVAFDSLADTIEVTHRARNRGGFAMGAVVAAEWVQDKQGMFTVDDFIHDVTT